MSSLRGKVAVVTGAGSGIGRALARELASRGARLAISDVNEEGLAETAAATKASGGDILQRRLDVSDPDAVAGYATEVNAHFGVVHQLYNNAGVAFNRPALESSLDDYRHVLDVNLWGVIHGTHAFLPHLVASGDGHLINVSSLNGYMAQPGMSHYCASKFAVRGFTESVRMEMLSAGHPVQVSVVHPGGVRTNIADAALASATARGLPVTEAEERRRRLYNEKLLKMAPEQAARIIADGVEAGRPRILVGNDARLVDALVRLIPARYPRVAVVLDRRLTGGR